MPRVDADLKLDFKDVLFRPKRSSLKSRSEVGVARITSSTYSQPSGCLATGNNVSTDACRKCLSSEATELTAGTQSASHVKACYWVQMFNNSRKAQNQFSCILAALFSIECVLSAEGGLCPVIEVTFPKVTEKRARLFRLTLPHQPSNPLVHTSFDIGSPSQSDSGHLLVVSTATARLWYGAPEVGRSPDRWRATWALGDFSESCL